MGQLCFVDVVQQYSPDNPESEVYGSTHITAELLRRILADLKQAHEWEAEKAFNERYGGAE